MPVGRYFRGLTSFDLLGNLIPGILVLFSLLLFLPDSRIPSSFLQYVLFILFAFILGFIIQAHASEASGKRTSFDKTMSAAESLPELSMVQSSSDDQSSEENIQTEDINCSVPIQDFILSLLHAIFGPLLWWIFPERGERLDDAILINRIWNHLSSTYSIPDNTDSLNVLYHLMSSRVDNISSPSRAIRMQALRNFHRGLWLSAWYSTLLVTGAIIADACFEPGETIYLGITYARPTFFSYWTPLWHISLVGIIAIICFWLLFESFEEDYIEYLFVDYAIGIETPSHELHFSEDEVIQFAGSVSNEITADSDIINKNIGEPEEESPTPENKED